MSGAGDDGSVKTKKQSAEGANDGGFEKWRVQFDLLSPAFAGEIEAKRLDTVLTSKGLIWTGTLPHLMGSSVDGLQ